MRSDRSASWKYSCACTLLAMKDSKNHRTTIAPLYTWYDKQLLSGSTRPLTVLTASASSSIFPDYHVLLGTSFRCKDFFCAFGLPSSRLCMQQVNHEKQLLIGSTRPLTVLTPSLSSSISLVRRVVLGTSFRCTRLLRPLFACHRHQKMCTQQINSCKNSNPHTGTIQYTNHYSSYCTIPRF